MEGEESKGLGCSGTWQRVSAGNTFGRGRPQWRRNKATAEAYIKSRKQLGWTLVVNQCGDGGFSGGSLDRSALQKLLEDTEARNLDCVVVYKVDRLSRSLLDFARFMDRFDQHSEGQC